MSPLPLVLPLAPLLTGAEAAAAIAMLVVVLVVVIGLLVRAREPAAAGAPRDSQDEARGPRVDVIVNPTKVSDGEHAGLVRALRVAGAGEVRLIETTVDEVGGAQARMAADDGADVVAVCGGDGTVMACVTGLAGTDVPLAIIPAGTGNLLARNLGIPLGTERAALVAVQGARRRIDVGAVGAERFAVMAGMGFDAAMLRDAPETAKARVGPLAYLGSAARNLREPGFLCTVTVDDGMALRRRARTVLVGNVGRLQGRLPVLPGAQPDDGLLDVVVISSRTTLEHLQVLIGFVVRRPPPRHMETRVGRRVVIEAVEPQPVQLDGDLRADTTRMVCEMRAAALTVCVPGPRALATGPTHPAAPAAEASEPDEPDEPDELVLPGSTDGAS